MTETARAQTVTCSELLVPAVQIEPERRAHDNGAGGGAGGVRKTLAPAHNKFHRGNGDDGKHYWLTPPELMASLQLEFDFTFDACPWPKPDAFDGLTCEWGDRTYANIPFGSIVHNGRKKGPTAWMRKAIAEARKGKLAVVLYPVDKWILMMLAAGAQVRNLGDVRWCATEDGSQGKGTGRHIAAFILDGRMGGGGRGGLNAPDVEPKGTNNVLGGASEK